MNGIKYQNQTSFPIFELSEQYQILAGFVGVWNLLCTISIPEIHPFCSRKLLRKPRGSYGHPKIVVFYIWTCDLDLDMTHPTLLQVIAHIAVNI